MTVTRSRFISRFINSRDLTCFTLGLFILVILILFSLTGCSSDKEKVPPTIKPVKTIQVGGKHQTVRRSFPGKIKATNEAILSFQVEGQVIQLPVLEGDKVKQGALLAKIDPKKYKDKVDQAQARHDLAKAQFKRASALVTNHHISEADYDKIKAEYEVAKADLSTANRNLDDTNLRAPFPGIVAKKFIDRYEYVKAKQKVLLLQDVTTVDIEISVPENLVVHLREEQNKITPVAIFEAAPKYRFPIRFKEFSTQADPETQTYTVVFTMNQPKEINVFPGMTTRVEVHIPDYSANASDFYTLPSSAVFNDENGKPSVWIVDPKTMTLQKRHVTVTRLSNTSIRVTQGLKPGDRVVTAGVYFLKANQKVKYLDPKDVK